jgi:hypothetical protein
MPSRILIASDRAEGVQFVQLRLIKEKEVTRVRFFILVIAATTVLVALRAEAHHSFTGAYNVDKTITIKGKIFQIALRSPHSFFYVETEDSKQWAIEGAAAGQFAQQGVDKDTFKVGDQVEVTANPSRTENSTRARLVKIVRPSDGKSWGTRAAETFQ